jgi:hypothetical protein
MVQTVQIVQFQPEADPPAPQGFERIRPLADSAELHAAPFKPTQIYGLNGLNYSSEEVRVA